MLKIMIRTLILSVTASLLAVPLLLGAFFFLIIEEKPSVVREAMVSPEQIERAKLVYDQHRQQAQKNLVSAISIRPTDLDIAANYLAKHFVNGNAHVSMANRQMHVRTSVPVSFQVIEGYINVEATFIEADVIPQIQSVRIGSFTVPDFFSHFLAKQSIQWLQEHSKYRNMVEAIKSIQITPDAINVLYRWQGGFNRPEKSLPLLSKSEHVKLYRYHMLLVENSSRPTKQNTQALSEVIQPLMQLAAKHSVNNQAVAENRAAILAATFHILGLPLKHLVPEATGWPRIRSQNITLDGRQDFAKHFIVSAAITAYADTALSDAIGLYKEIEDTRSGSGFSFNDIAADRAGTRFGERATSNHKEAVRLQQLVARGLEDTDLMPPWSDLPEHLSKAEFRQYYGNLDTPAYHLMMKKIEQRVAALPFLH